MFSVIHKETKEIYDVYHISYDKTGFPHFLIFKDNQWMRMSAKHFAPVSMEVIHEFNI